MKAMAITDHGNMFGVFEFVKEAYKHKDANGNLKVKPIVGCEFYITENRHRKTFSKEEKDLRIASRNIEKVTNTLTEQLNVADMLNNKYIVLSKNSVKFLEEKYKEK